MELLILGMLLFRLIQSWLLFRRHTIRELNSTCPLLLRLVETLILATRLELLVCEASIISSVLRTSEVILIGVLLMMELVTLLP